MSTLPLPSTGLPSPTSWPDRAAAGLKSRVGGGWPSSSSNSPSVVLSANENGNIYPPPSPSQSSYLKKQSVHESIISIPTDPILSSPTMFSSLDWAPPPLNLVDSLKSHPLFSIASEEFVVQLAARMHTRYYQPGDVVIREGEVGSSMFFVIKGLVRAMSRDGETVFREMRRREFFGEIACLFRVRRTATVIAATRCLLARLTMADLANAVGSYPEIGEMIRLEAEERYQDYIKRCSSSSISSSPSPSSLDQHQITLDRFRMGEMRERFTKVPLFQNCSQEFLHSMSLVCDVRSYNINDMIVRRGDVGQEMFFIKSGYVEVVGENLSRVYARIGPDSFFGETAVLLEVARTQNVRAVTPVVLYVLHKEALENLMKEYPEVRESLSEISRHIYNLFKIEENTKALINDSNVDTEPSSPIDSRSKALYNLRKSISFQDKIHKSERGAGDPSSKRFSDSLTMSRVTDFNPDGTLRSVVAPRPRLWSAPSSSSVPSSSSSVSDSVSGAFPPSSGSGQRADSISLGPTALPWISIGPSALNNDERSTTDVLHASSGHSMTMIAEDVDNQRDDNGSIISDEKTEFPIQKYAMDLSLLSAPSSGSRADSGNSYDGGFSLSVSRASNGSDAALFSVLTGDVTVADDDEFSTDGSILDLSSSSIANDCNSSASLGNTTVIGAPCLSSSLSPSLSSSAVSAMITEASNSSSSSSNCSNSVQFIGDMLLCEPRSQRRQHVPPLSSTSSSSSLLSNSSSVSSPLSPSAPNNVSSNGAAANTAWGTIPLPASSSTSSSSLSKMRSSGRAAPQEKESDMELDENCDADLDDQDDSISEDADHDATLLTNTTSSQSSVTSLSSQSSSSSSKNAYSDPFASWQLTKNTQQSVPDGNYNSNNNDVDNSNCNNDNNIECMDIDSENYDERKKVPSKNEFNIEVKDDDDDAEEENVNDDIDVEDSNDDNSSKMDEDSSALEASMMKGVNIKSSVAVIRNRATQRRRASIAVWSDPKLLAFVNDRSGGSASTSQTPSTKSNSTSSSSSSSSSAVASPKTATSAKASTLQHSLYHGNDQDADTTEDHAQKLASPSTSLDTIHQDAGAVSAARVNPKALIDTVDHDLLVKLLSVLDRRTLSQLAPVSRRFAAAVATLKKLLDFSQDGSKVSDSDVLTGVRWCGRHLRNLKLNNCYFVSPAGLQHIAPLAPALQEINLSNCWEITSPALTVLANSCPRLKLINLSNCKKITDDGVAALLTRLPALAHLTLSYCKLLSNDTMAAIGRHGIQSKDAMAKNNNNDDNSQGDDGEHNLSMGNGAAHDHSNRVQHQHDHNKDGAAHVGGLMTLDLQRCTGIGDGGFVQLAQGSLLALTDLILADCSFLTDATLLSLSQSAPNLRVLNLSFCCAMTDAGVSHLAAGCVRIMRLDLSFCGSAVSDTSLTEISDRMPDLEYLSVRGCIRVTDAGVSALATRALRLRELNISNCKNVSVEVQTLHSSMRWSLIGPNSASRPGTLRRKNTTL